MKNPLGPDYTDADDQRLVRAALDGDRSALDRLIKRHQPFIYNVAWKMVHDPHDALDLTQETLLKVITKLAQFKFNSAFRTWLYRIVFNEFLQSKRRAKREQFASFEAYGAGLDQLPNGELTREEEIEQAELSRELQISCMSGMLMCLTREQRLVYLLGDSFGVDHKLGAELLNISPQNFRVRLHRTRKELYNFMNNKCGLVNTANPCRCPKKTKTLKQMGALQPDKLQFNISYRNKIADYVSANYVPAMDAVDEAYTTLFRDHPTRENFEQQNLIDQVLDNDVLGFFETD